jgi:uncharacterized membrane protein YphA (DoxX/SURF4 family)
MERSFDSCTEMYLINNAGINVVGVILVIVEMMSSPRLMLLI